MATAPGLPWLPAEITDYLDVVEVALIPEFLVALSIINSIGIATYLAAEKFGRKKRYCSIDH